MNRYPLWKNILVSIVLFVGLIYALPNIFDQDPALEISGSRRAEADAATEARVREALDKAGNAITSLDAVSNKLLLRFDDSES